MGEAIVSKNFKEFLRAFALGDKSLAGVCDSGRAAAPQSRVVCYNRKMRGLKLERTGMMAVLGASIAGVFETGPVASLITVSLGIVGLVIAARHAKTEATRVALAGAVIIGLAIGTAFIAIEALVFWPSLPASIRAAATVPLRQRLVYFAVAACQDEVICRLFGVSVLVLLLYKLRGERQPSAPTFLAAIGLSAALYVIMHLPAVIARTPLTSFLALRELALHFTTPIAWGIIYWRRGLAASMAAHAAAHLPIQLGITLLPS